MMLFDMLGGGGEGRQGREPEPVLASLLIWTISCNKLSY
jgi:hypothetical protein